MKKLDWKGIRWGEYVVYYIFLGIFLLFSVVLYDKGFLSINNLMNIIRQSAIMAIMGVGMTFVLSAAEIDLSFGSIVALAAIVTAMVLRSTDSILLSVLGGLAVGVFFGFINGLFVAKVGIPSFLITLGMSSIILGIARWVSGLQSIPIINDRFTFLFGSGNIGSVPVLLLWVAAVMLVGHFVLTKTPFGRQVLATGGNRLTALYSGINVNRIKLAVMTLNGALAALAGILYSGRLHGARYTLGENDVMIVIAGTIIGGTSMFGGKGYVIGSVIGAIIMAMLSNGLILFGLSVDQQMISRGAIIIIAVALTMRKQRNS
ncbi:MAG TPA: ABC transporter permease [Limnochordia bacterium]|jgi:ribose transport system permease protein|nr:ABC transporter permease [Limnochordia bacterium]